MNTAADVLAWAGSKVGIVENPPNSNHVPFWDEIGRHDLQGQPWCACFVTDGLKQNNVPFPTVDTPGGFVYCPDEEHYARAHGTAVATIDALPGDGVLFQWGDHTADHTGFFVSWVVHGQTFNTIEGNTGVGGNDGVARKVRTVSEVQCIFRPPYGVAGPAGATPISRPPGTIDLGAIARMVASAKTQTLRVGSSGLAVGILQGRLRDLGYNVTGMVDANVNTASFGPKTFVCVENFQRNHRLSVDGVVGPKTWSVIFP